MEPEIVIGIFVIAILGGALGIALGRYVWPRQTIVDVSSSLAVSQQDVARLTQENETLRGRSQELNHDLRDAVADAQNKGENAARLAERSAQLSAKIDEQVAQQQLLISERDVAQRERDSLSTDVARFGEREIALNGKIAEQATQLADMQKQLTAEFENIANRILKARASELSENSQKELAGILDPLRERIGEFQRKVETTFDTENRDVLSLKEQIKAVVEISHAIGSQADSLARALRGDSQILGRWGELALERILEAAGLVEGREYVSQGRGLSLRNEEGGLQKPDIIIRLPEDRAMIVDSKVPLASYERLIAAIDELDRAACGSQFVHDVKGHIDGLANKRYQENDKLLAHDCVLMFVPIEGALAAALVNDPDLFIYAWTRKVVLVGPPTLLMTMRTVASIWRYQQQGEHAQEIARLAGDLCDKLSLSLSDLNTVAEKMSAALAAHNDAMKRLVSGRRNALSLGDRIRDLGVKTKRPIPPVIVDGVSITGGDKEDPDDDVLPEHLPDPQFSL
jgi:DNA recombination protein RmuC